MLLQSVFSALCTDGSTIELLHGKLEDNKFPGSAQQQGTCHSSFVNFKQLVLAEHRVQRAPLLLDWCKISWSVQIQKEFCVCQASDERCCWNVSNQSEASLKEGSWGILHMEKYEDYYDHPRNQHVRRRDGVWWGRSECSEFHASRSSTVALTGSVGTGFGCQHPRVAQSPLASEFRGS